MNAAGTSSAPGTASATIVAAPTQPVLSGLAATVTAGTTGIVVSTGAQSGATFTWTVTGGTVTAGGGTGTGNTSVTVTAGSPGTLTVQCVAKNAAGASSAPGTASATIVAAPTQPVLSGLPSYATTGTSGIIASTASQGGSTFTWTVSGGTVTAGGGTNTSNTSVTVTAGAPGTLTVQCVATNAAGTASSPGSASSTIVAVPPAPTITAPATIVANTSGYAASVTPDQSPETFQWSITGDATLVNSTGTSVAFSTGGSTSITLSCTATNGAGTSGPAGSVTWNNGTKTASLLLSLSDASSEDWATIGVRVLGLGLVPKGGGAPVPVYAAPTPAPALNLAQLDQVSELLDQPSVAPGTYTGAVLTLGAEPGDVSLVTAAQPAPDFPEPPGTTVPPTRIQVQGAAGAEGRRTVTVTVPFPADRQVSAGRRAPLDLEFDLGHPAFLVSHQAAGDAAPVWAVTFQGLVRPRQVQATALVPRHLVGRITAADAGSLTLAKVPTDGPADATGGGSLRVLVDPDQGTACTDLDTGDQETLRSFAPAAGAGPGRYVRVAARAQGDGSLVAVRIWTGSALAQVRAGAEGHLLGTDLAAGTLTVADPAGTATLQVAPTTRFFLRAPGVPGADAAAIGAGAGFLADLVRGFKVHVTAEPGLVPATAATVEIETARFEGRPAVEGGRLAWARSAAWTGDGYPVRLAIGSAAAAGTGGDPLWVPLAPGTAGLGSAATVDPGGSAAPIAPAGVGFGAWDGAGWSARAVFLKPTPLPLGTVASPGSGTGFALDLPGGARPVQVDLGLTDGPAAQVYRVDRTGGTVTVTPLDPAAAGGLEDLAAGAPVRVHGVPQADGRIKALVVFVYTGRAPLR
jgi:hypothetical protein